jgi:hypothetical protein
MTQSRVNSFGIVQPMGIDQCPSPFAYSRKEVAYGQIIALMAYTP